MSHSTREEVARPSAQRVVLAVPDGEWADAISEAFARAGYRPHRCPSPEAATLALSYRDPSAVILDASFIQAAGFRLLDAVRIAAPGVPVIVTADAKDEQLRLKSLVLGAEDCLARPCSGQEAVIRVRRALDRRQAVSRLRDDKDSIADQTEALKRDLAELRTQLKRNVTLLERAVEFHQRLDPGADPASFQRTVLRHLSAQLSVDRLAFLSPAHEGAAWFVTHAWWGVADRLADRIRVHAHGDLASLLEGAGTPLVVERLSQVPAVRVEVGILAAGGFTAALPVLQKGKLLGIVLLGEGPGGGAPDGETLRAGQFLLSALVPVFISQERWTRERHVSAGTLGLLVTHLEARDPYLRGHSLRVARLAEDIGLRLGMDGDDLSLLTVSALLHDVGRFEVDVELWSKMAPLTVSDWRLIRRHPEDGVRLLTEASWPDRILAAVRHHHERWDGGGYPAGLAGEAIPLEARILAVADSLEALTSPRAYRPARSQAEALRMVRSDAGAKFDPELAESLLLEAGASA